MSETDLLSTTDVEPPLRISSADEQAWDGEADLVVVGFGGAGAAAALEGREQGISVIAIDRFEGGGATAYSGGVFYASNTRIQREAGFEDSAEEMRKYLAAEMSPVSDATLRRFCEGSSADFDWVSRFVPYSSSAYTGKATYPPEGKFLFFCGNEKVPSFAAQAKPAPRGHRAVGSGYTGHIFYAGLRQAALESGVRLVPHAPVRRLVVDETGAVVGVEANQIRPEAIAEHQALYKQINPHLPMIGKKAERAIARCRAFEKANGIRRLIRAKGGVVLSTGGFVYNLQLLSKHRPDLANAHAEIMRLGSMGCDGSGMALASTVGGNVDLMSNAFVGKTISPPEIYLHGILVNRLGHRFVNEDAYVGVVGGAIARQPDNGAAWLVVDAKTFWKGFWDALTIGRGMFYFWGLPALMNVVLGGTRRGGSLAALARKCGMPAAALDHTVSAHNQRVAAGEPDAFAKLPGNSSPIGSGAYYAINMSTRNKFGPTPVFTLGGLRVDEESGGVLREDRASVSGLYAAGRTAVGLCSAGYMSGMSLADLVFSGRRAARAVAGTLRRADEPHIVAAQ